MISMKNSVKDNRFPHCRGRSIVLVRNQKEWMPSSIRSPLRFRTKFTWGPSWGHQSV